MTGDKKQITRRVIAAKIMTIFVALALGLISRVWLALLVFPLWCGLALVWVFADALRTESKP